MLGFVVLFIFLSAFFSCSEMVLLALSKFEIKQFLEVGKYKKLVIWMKNPSWVITGILIGNNIVNIGFGSVYSFFILKKAEVIGVSLGVASLFSFLTAAAILLVFGEIFPKNLGKAKAKTLIFYIYRPLLFFMYLFSPIIALVYLIEKYITRSKLDHDTKFTRDDLHKFAGFIRQEGVIEEESEEMIHSYLEFRKKKIETIMTPREDIQAINIDSVRNIFHEIYDLGRSRIPVYRNDLDEIEGTLNIRDLLGLDPEEHIDIGQILRSPIFVEGNETTQDVFKLFKENRKHIAMVKKNNKIIGLVTMKDILEEIVGEIVG